MKVQSSSTVDASSAVPGPPVTKYVVPEVVFGYDALAEIGMLPAVWAPYDRSS